MVLRDLGLEKSSSVVTLVAKRPKSEAFLLVAGAKPLKVSTAHRTSHASHARCFLARGSSAQAAFSLCVVFPK